VGKPGERYNWGDLCVDGWIILEWIFEERVLYRYLVGKPEGKRPLGRPKLRWVNNIRKDLREEGCV
jgi:hypothetical protein